MRPPSDPGGHVWPSPAQERLLQAALARDGAASRHFLAWLDMVDLEGPIDEGTYRTLPLLWAALSSEGFDHPLLPRLKGVLRNSWVHSTRQLSLAERLLSLLHAQEIRTLVCKGLPIGQIYYDRAALRPMNDVDIVVPADDIERASAVLEAEGFAAGRKDWGIEKALRHALVHRHPDHGEVDLHWHVIYECPTRAADAHFWDAAVPFRIGQADTLRPTAVDLLLHVLVHGIRWNLSPPMRWIPDAVMILRSGEELDWDRLTGFAVETGLARRVALGLDYLRDRFDVDVPARAVERLYGKGGLVERVELMAMRGQGGRSGWRHVRRGAYLLRLARSEDARHLPRAVASELLERWRTSRRTDGQGGKPQSLTAAADGTP